MRRDTLLYACSRSGLLYNYEDHLPCKSSSVAVKEEHLLVCPSLCASSLLYKLPSLRQIILYLLNCGITYRDKPLFVALAHNPYEMLLKEEVLYP